MTEQSLSHAELMDETYRYQRLIYDVTRRFFLLGRDHLINTLNPGKDARILEVACGTGRNLAMISKRYPDCALYGLDISDEMLRTARDKLGLRATLVKADACKFEAEQMFGTVQFDRIILSYSVSMIPDWQAALETAVRHLSPGGQLHVVDFGDQSGLPLWFRSILLRWLAKFHVAPRVDLTAVLAEIATKQGGKVVCHGRLRGYVQHGVLTKAIKQRL
ncbi:MAG: methyltransferase domain-containing protein [Cypionkella sp.]|uniref:class I SAM-dependent methyltransferase n=1 Tax=Cypionkella sp. TaxID=2811411 RepID=UPI002ABA2067|nr:methyltransferase domain-containing protein [Cypionkella sp.]MDZ4310108.1 methyltransferase domain-containing protein [Cypionkella sp.]MDZ4392700.1 methyltransferase domain-containing protein [Cypionkella sp.]